MSVVAPSSPWLQVFPGPLIPDVLAYVSDTWQWLQATYPETIAFHWEEPRLTDSLCEALNDRDRRQRSTIHCDFQAETWELRRNPLTGDVKRIARADIRVTLGAPGTPHLVLEFKKLDGTANSRWRYCFDGVNRFVEGKYSVQHEYGVMYGLSCIDLTTESVAMAAYISSLDYPQRLNCVSDNTGSFIAAPSPTDPLGARFDTRHLITVSSQIVLLHVLIPCSCLPSCNHGGKVAKKRRTKRALPAISE
jgi:hypothetical protein